MSKKLLGLNLQEGISNATSPKAGVSKHNVGMIMQRSKGPVNVPIEITSLSEDREVFGVGSPTKADVQVEAMYKHAGQYGVTMYGIRLAGEGSTAATASYTVAPINDQAVVEDELQAVEADKLASKKYSFSALEEGDKVIINDGSSDHEVVAQKGESISNFVKRLSEWLTSQKVNAVAVFEDYTYAYSKNTLTVSHTQANTAIALVVSVANTTVDPLKVFTVTSAFNGTESPGEHGNLLMVDVFPPSQSILDHPSPSEWAMVVYEDGVVVDTLYASDMIELSERSESSKYVLLEANSPEHTLTSKVTLMLTGGLYVTPTEADYEGVVENDEKKGFKLFDGQDVQIVLSDVQTLEMAQYGNAYALENGRVTFVCNTPKNARESDFIAYNDALNSGESLSNTAVYVGWMTIQDGKYKKIIPSASSIIGSAYIHLSKNQGGHAHIVPGGVGARINAITVDTKSFDRKEHTKYLEAYGVNFIGHTNKNGFFVVSSRSQSKAELHQSISIRRQTMFYLNYIDENYQWLSQTSNSGDLVGQAKTSLRQFFKRQYELGALENSIPFEEAYIFVSDEQNNPVGQSRKEKNIDINWIPTEVLEYANISLNRNDGVLNVS
ncbi:hypothetical protein [Flammeovirga agarivorans]|uniref:Tail sheath protein n=1 Tax=Flammeovirga agarivorans TaxID=2726742 RepID=A0A7X8SRD8_9BACT|nr:hypothetical protein [Flammeovirga agarivorans]NLR94867.1 hypothetical protein [Flammeovirga agarivorans]